MNKLILVFLSLFICLSTSCIISSSAFANNTNIPVLYTQDGSNISPPLQWKELSVEAKYIALTVLDPDAASAPNHLVVHWLFYDLPSSFMTLPEGVVIGSSEYPGLNGRNTRGQNQYMGPAPPATDPPHHYWFTLYGLTNKTGLTEGATLDAFQTAIKNVVVDSCAFVGLYGRKL